MMTHSMMMGAVSAAALVFAASLNAHTHDVHTLDEGRLAISQADVTDRAPARGSLAGSWWRYPQTNVKPDPKLPSPAPDSPAAPPLKPEHRTAWEARQKAIREAEERGAPLFDVYNSCVLNGMPTFMMRKFPFEILETPGRLTLIQEANNETRRIYLDEPQVAIEDAEPRYWGHSVGRWDGGTLVVDTVGIRENVLFMDVPHSAEMRITERIRLLAPEFMRVDFTITDPVYFTEPWDFAFTYQRMPGYRIQEYVCDSNRAFEDPQSGETRLRLLDE